MSSILKACEKKVKENKVSRRGNVSTHTRTHLSSSSTGGSGDVIRAAWHVYHHLHRKLFKLLRESSA